MNKIWKTRLLSVLTVGAIFAVGILPEGHWLENVGVAVHVWTWTLLVLGLIGVFILDADEMPKFNPWFSIPLTAAWIAALAFVGWTIALGVYAVTTFFAVVRRFNL